MNSFNSNGIIGFVLALFYKDKERTKTTIVDEVMLEFSLVLALLDVKKKDVERIVELVIMFLIAFDNIIETDNKLILVRDFENTNSEINCKGNYGIIKKMEIDIIIANIKVERLVKGLSIMSERLRENVILPLFSDN